MTTSRRTSVLAGVLVAVASAAVALAGCADTARGAPETTWSAVAASPLSARRAPVTAWVADRFVVVGGWSGPACPPNADCVYDPATLEQDGAAYDPATDTWEAIAPAPVDVPGARVAVVGDVLYLLTDGLGSEVPAAMLAYDAAADRWEALPAPPGEWSDLVAAGDVLLAVPGTDEYGPQPDAAFDPANRTWHALPDDPLGPSYDRRALWLGDRLLLTAKDLVRSPGSEGPSLVRLAELDGAFAEWSAPTETEIIGWGPVWAGGRVVFPETGSADGGEVNTWGRSYAAGGVYDPADGTWSELGVTAEVVPWAATGLERLVVGGRVVVADGLLDPVTGSWSALPPLPREDVLERGAAANDETIFVWGGATTGRAVADGYLLTRADGAREAGAGASGEGGTATRRAEQSDAEQGAEQGAGQGDDTHAWSEVAAGPLSARNTPVIAWVADRFVVVGGWSGAICPEYAYCVLDPGTPLSDGASYDPATNAWAPITAAPTAVTNAAHAVVGDVLYVLTRGLGPTDGSAATPETLLAYDAAADRWESLPPPPGTRSALVAAGEVLVAIPATDQGGPQSDAAYDPATRTWRELPDDPLGPSYQRQAVWLGDRLLLTATDLAASPESGVPPLVRLAELDSTLTGWSAPQETEVVDLSETMAGSWRRVSVAGRVVFPDAGRTDPGSDGGRSYPYGGVLDPADYSWHDLGAVAADGGLAIALPALAVGDRVIVANGLLDPVTGDWSVLPTVPGGGVMGRGAAANDTAIFVWGGATIASAVADGYLLRP